MKKYRPLLEFNRHNNNFFHVKDDVKVNFKKFSSQVLKSSHEEIWIFVLKS